MTTTTTKTATREALIDAAEQLFATEGLDGASLAAITKKAGQRNGGAIHYHFGGRDGLLGAVLDRHETVLDEARMTALNELRQSGPVSIEALMRVIVESLAGQLDSDSGRSFLVIQSERFSDGSQEFRSASTQLIVAEIQSILDGRFDANEQAERFRLVTQLIVHRLADRSREETSGNAGPRGLVIDTLVSAATSILGGSH